MDIADASWSGLLANLAIIAVLISVWTHSQDWTNGWPRPAYLALLAVLTSGGTIAVMNLPFEFRPGVITDLRTTLIALSGFLGGPIVGIATGIVAALYRAHLGGVGWPAGVIGATVATCVGIGGYLLLRGRSPNRRDIFVFAAAAAAAGIVGFFFLPEEIRIGAITKVGLPTMVLIFVSATIAGLAIVQENRRREIADENLIYRAIIDALPDSLNARTLAAVSSPPIRRLRN
jgi:LytS/YehU family sensor histidine kinase